MLRSSSSRRCASAMSPRRIASSICWSMRLRSFCGDRPGPARAGSGSRACWLLLLHALGEFAQELVHRLAQLVGEALDLLVRGAAVHGFAQAVLRGAQFPLRIGQIAVLDLQRHRPQPVGDLHEILVGLGPPQALRAEAQAHEHAPLRRELVRRDEQRIERDLDALAVVRIEHELAPLLDEGLGERLGEGPLRQREVDRRRCGPPGPPRPWREA